MPWGLWTVTALFFALSSGAWPFEAAAAGPWRAQVVDAETGQPVEGAVVLAVWYRYFATIHGSGGGKYYASAEVVASADGRFVIGARSTFTWLPFLTTVKGPELSIFKPGYGQWRFRGTDESSGLSAWERDVRVEEAWRRFKREGVTIELPPLKTREKRLGFLSWASPSGPIPDARMSRYLQALDQERVALGLAPLGRGKAGREQ